MSDMPAPISDARPGDGPLILLWLAKVMYAHARDADGVRAVTEILMAVAPAIAGTADGLEELGLRGESDAWRAFGKFAAWIVDKAVGV